MSHIARTTGLAAIVALLLTAPAFAHAHLRSAVPAVGSTITVSPGLIDLIFSESVNFEFTGITVTGPDKTEVPTTGAMLMDNDDAYMVDVPGTLAPGEYTVDWHALSTDGHKTSGSYKFTVKP